MGSQLLSSTKMLLTQTVHFLKGQDALDTEVCDPWLTFSV